ncbi:acetyltransferase (GNAT) family protein [Thermosporothrix hazakensis]|jgi:ribosomal protein S18 acetylase RimI-like enzyme|uniref:Acetyltransferase (GNAT) family protein n=2 Tax=Thermosporothrix TaxID=768650 RepID=A0A326UNF4_THEHA|nr:GNAT family N-acetyltransferase [Thermosporothrix hazakensis]PZW35889.1 acetyltransferase (GNAT) family protein [Thermosporothrix hazakensis]BBH88355.1 hypothetical protein KTC_31060 [Thermosporothrix sp. COM3]GCE46542.1 hypothetical protein KTH_14110 [Thermosporothrix hazakensis]
MTVRLQASDDIELLVTLLHDADEDDARIRTTLTNPAYMSAVALVGEQVVGAVTVRWQEDESEIEYVAVVPEARGRGYGKEIIAQVVEEGRRRKVGSLLVGTANSSWENIAFYQKCGFRMDHVRRDFFAYIQPPIVEDGIPMLDMLVLRYRL